MHLIALNLSLISNLQAIIRKDGRVIVVRAPASHSTSHAIDLQVMRSILDFVKTEDLQNFNLSLPHLVCLFVVLRPSNI